MVYGVAIHIVALYIVGTLLLLVDMGMLGGKKFEAGDDREKILEELMSVRGRFRDNFRTSSVDEIVGKVSKLDRCCFCMMNNLGVFDVEDWKSVEMAVWSIYDLIDTHYGENRGLVYRRRDRDLRDGKNDVYGVLFEWEVKVKGFLRNGSFYCQDGVDVSLP